VFSSEKMPARAYGRRHGGAESASGGKWAIRLRNDFAPIVIALVFVPLAYDTMTSANSLR
jgi:hypothetical protein